LNEGRAKIRTPAERQFIATLAHGLEVLEVLSGDGSEMTLAALSKRIGRTKPTTWRLVHTLVRLGYVRQDLETRRFAIAARVLALSACFDGMDVKEVAGPFLRQLSARVSETVNMAVGDDDHLIYVERIKTTQIININLHVGSRLPLYNTSMGRALLAYYSTDQLREYVARLNRVPAARKYTQNGNRLLFEVLAETRQRGFALNDEDFAVGLRSVAVPCRNADGRVVAAINIAVPSARVSLRQLRTVHAPELLKTAQEISTALGYASRPPSVPARRNLA